MHSEKEARELVIKAGLVLIEEKLIARTWGNISARISETEFVITPSGKPYESLKPADLVKVKISDLSYDGNVKPSSEKGLHANVYKLRKDINFIIHTHQNYATAISLDKNNTVAKVAKYALPGTSKLASKVEECVKKNLKDNVFLLERHGAIALGKDYDSAFACAMKLEEDAKKYYEAHKTSSKKESKAYLDDYAQMMGLHNKPMAYEDKEAIELLRFKNSLAAHMSSKPMKKFDVLLQNFVYKKKYSKLKDK